MARYPEAVASIPTDPWRAGASFQRACGASSLWHEHTISAQAISGTEPSPLCHGDVDAEANQDDPG